MDVELGRERATITAGWLNIPLSLSPALPRELPVSAIALLYIIISSAWAAWLSPPEEVKAVLALPSLALLPLLVGTVAVRLLPIETPELDWFGRSLIGWLLGVLILTTFAVLLQLGDLWFLLQRYGLIALALAAVGFVGASMRATRPQTIRLPISKVSAVALIVAMIIALAPKAIAAWYTPFPLVSQNFLDPLFYAQPALRMLEHGYMDLENLAHAPALLTLVAIHSQLYDVQPLSILWMGPFLLHAVLGAGLFLWTRELSGRWTTALLVSGMGVFVLTGTTIFQATPVIMRSNTLLFALVPLCLYVMHRLIAESNASRRSQIEGLIVLQLSAGLLFLVMNVGRFGLFATDVRVPLLVLGATAIGLVLVFANRTRQQWPGVLAFFPIVVCFQIFHIYEGAIFLTAIIVYGIALALRGPLLQPALAISLSLGAIALFFIQDSELIIFQRDFSLASSLVFGDIYNEIPVRFFSRARDLATVLHWEVITVVSIGAAGFFIRPRGGYGRAVIIAAAFMFLMYIMPDARAHRIGRALAPFIAFLLVAGADHIGWLVRQVVRRINRDRAFVQEAVQFGLTAALFPVILMPFLHFNTSIPQGQEHHSKVADVEYTVADWLRKNTDENIRIVSDYRTMQILTSLANKVSLTERQLFPIELTDDGRAQMASIKNRVLSAYDSRQAWNAIQSLEGTEPAREVRFLEATGLDSEPPTTYVVLTGRTTLWVNSPSIHPIRQSNIGEAGFGLVTLFQDPTYFELVAYFDDDAFIFEVLPEGG